MVTEFIRPEQTVKEVAERYPATQKVFAKYDLDLCCGGIHPIRVAAQAKGVDESRLISELNAAISVTVHRLDLRGLEPPQPMVEILSKLPELGRNDILEVTHFREPIPLYAHLEEAGFAHAIEKKGEGLYLLTIWRKNG